MRTGNGFWVVLAAIASWTLVAPAFAQHEGHDHGHGHDHHEGDHDHGDHDHGDQSMGDFDPEEMAKWMEMATPGEHHHHMKAWLGSWSTRSRFRMTPESPWMESEGHSKIKEVLGGRFVTEECGGDMMGSPFEGFGLYGYDNFRKEYTSVWTDTMGTAISTSTGQCDQSGKVFTFNGTYDDVGKNTKNVKYRLVRRVINDTTQVLEMHGPGPDGKEFKSFEITYTRK